jgi:hypothetical protein
MLAYTDGLVERRGENLDVSLARLQHSTLGTEAPLEDLLSRLVADLGRDGREDDTAILGVRWVR